MKTKRKLLPLALMLLFVFSAHFQAQAQEDGPYPVYVYLIVNGTADSAATQKFRVGKSQSVNLRDANTAARYYWLTVSPGFTVNLSKENTDTSIAAGTFKEGKYKLNTRGVLQGVVTIKKIYSDYKVTLFSGRDFTDMAFDYGVGSYPASQGALSGVGGDNAVSSVYVPSGFWVRFCENENKGKGGGKCELFNGRGGNLRNDNAASFVLVGKGTPPKFEEPLKLPKPNTKPLPNSLPKSIPTQRPIGN